MSDLRAARLGTCLVTAFVLANMIAQGPVSAIALPPPPAPIGWSHVQAIHSPSWPVPSSLAARPDGLNPIAVGTEYDTVFDTYNLTLMARYYSGWAYRIVESGLTWLNGATVATTDQFDRAGVFCFVGSSGGPGGAYVGFMPGFSVVATSELVSDTGGVQSAALAATPEGNVMALWLDYNGSYGLYSNHSANGAGWDGNLTVVAGASYIQNYRLAAVGPDAFMAVWQEYAGALFHLWGSIYTAAAGWSAPAELVTPADSLGGLAVAGSASAGRGAAAVWSQNGLNATLILVKYTNAWWGPEQVAYINGTGTNEIFPQVDVDGRGTTHLVWGSVPEGSIEGTLTYQREDADLQWSPPAQFHVNGLVSLQIAAADDGGVAVTWEATAASSQYRPFVAREVPGSGWRAAEAIDELFSPAHNTYALFADLATGGNYTAVWVNIEGGERLAVSRQFVAGNDPPALTVSSPAEGAITSDPTVLVEGRTAPDAKVDVNGVAAAVAADGSFSVRIALANGTHTITVVAFDAWGNSATQWVNATFADPVPGLEAQLAAAQAEALAAHELAHTLQQRADAADVRMANLSEQLNTSNQIYQHLQTDMDFLKASSENTTAAEAKANAAQASAGTATVLGLLGVVVGLAGVGMALMKGRGGRPPVVVSGPSNAGAPKTDPPTSGTEK